MTRGEIEFIGDSILIDKIIAIDLAINYGIKKNAGVVDTLKNSLSSGVSTISNSIAESLKDEIDTHDTKTILESIGNIIATGGLFLLWPPLGIINAAATTVFGVNAITIAMKIFNTIKDSILGGKNVTPADVSDVTKSITIANSDNPFVILRFAERNDNLFRLLNQRSGGGGGGGLSNLFKSLNPLTGKSLVVGFMGWAVKAALLGAGLLAVSGTAAHLLGVNKKPDYQPSQPEGASLSSLNPTGNGQTNHNQSSNTKWVVPVPSGSISQMLLQWAAYVYHDFEDSNTWNVIGTTPSFNKMVEELKRGQESNSNQVTIPSQYKSVKQIVDQFAADAKAKIKETNVKSQ